MEILRGTTMNNAENLIKQHETKRVNLKWYKPHHWLSMLSNLVGMLIAIVYQLEQINTNLKELKSGISGVAQNINVR